MTEQRFRAAIIGLGFIGAGDQVSGDRLGQQVSDLDGTHFEALSRHPLVDVVAGSSRDGGRRERFSHRSGAQTYADWREMLDNEQLDIVSVATYAGQHAEITLACAQAGVKAVYCEKPMATSAADAIDMDETCQRSGTILAINHNRRFHPLYRRLAEFVSEGELGDLISARVNWGSGRLGNVGTHLFDALMMVSGREIQEVSATLDLSERPDCRGSEFRDCGGWGMFRMRGGLMAIFEAPDYSRAPAKIILNGSQGLATIDGETVTIDWWNGKQEQWSLPERTESSMDRAVAEIVDALQFGKSFSPAARLAVRTLEAIVACHVSHDRNSEWVKLPLSEPDRSRPLNIA